MYVHILWFISFLPPSSESFQTSKFFASGGQSIGISALASVLPMNIQDWFPLGWTGWMALLTQWTRVWVNSRSWWWRGRPGVLQFMGSQGVGHDWATELNSNAVMFLYFIYAYKSTLYHRLQNPMQSFTFLVSELTLYHSPPSLIVSLIYICTIL